MYPTAAISTLQVAQSNSNIFGFADEVNNNIGGIEQGFLQY